ADQAAAVEVHLAGVAVRAARLAGARRAAEAPAAHAAGVARAPVRHADEGAAGPRDGIAVGAAAVLVLVAGRVVGEAARGVGREAAGGRPGVAVAAAAVGVAGAGDHVVHAPRPRVRRRAVPERVADAAAARDGRGASVVVLDAGASVGRLAHVAEAAVA